MNWVVLVLCSALLFAAANVIRKHVLSKEHSLEFLAARGFFTVVLLLFLAPWADMSIDLRVLGLIYIASLITAVGYYYQTKAQRRTEISYLAPLQNLSPLFLFLIAFLFLHETITVVQFLGLCGLVIGSYIIAVNPKEGILGPLKEFQKDYWLHILVSVILLAVAAVFDKFMLGLVKPATYLFFGWLFMNINYIVLDWLQYDWAHLAVDFKKGWHWLFLSAVFSIVSMLMFYNALILPGVLVSLAFPLRRVSALIETICGGTLFHEADLLRKVFACLIMLVGIVLIAA